MNMELIDRNKIKYLSIPIAPVLVGEDVHYEMGALKEWIDDIPTVKAIPLDKVKQAREEIEAKSYNEAKSYSDHIDGSWCDDIQIVELDDVLEVLDKLIAESEEE